MSEELYLEDDIIMEINVQEQVKLFQPEIQEIFYRAYGPNLESKP